MKENEMIHTGRVLIVEGKYDAARLSHLTDAMILLTDGFGIYSDKKRQQLFKALAQKNGLILLTDSDAAGFRIRTYITNLVGEKNVVQAYVPAIHGKEKRKEQPGKEGLLGVEGVDDAIVLQALRDALGAEAGAAAARPEGRQITYTDLYEWGLSGKPGSAAAARRQALSSCPTFSESASIHSPFSRTSPSPDFKSSSSSRSLSGVPPIAALTEKRSSESPQRKPRFPTVSNEICT